MSDANQLLVYGCQELKVKPEDVRVISREVTKETEDLITEMKMTRDQAINVVDDIRYLIVSMNGMAMKSLVEQILQDRWPALDEGQARDLTNGAEFAAKGAFQLNPLQWMTTTRPEPDIEDWPEVRDFQPERKYVEIARTVFLLSRQFHAVRILYRSGSIASEDATLIVRNYSFLVPMNSKIGAEMLAKEIRNYSSSKQAQYLANILDEVAQKESNERSN